MYEFFRWLALLTGWPAQAVFFKRKTYYEDKKAQSRIVRGSALIVSNHYNILDYILNVFLFSTRKLYVVLSEWIFQQSRFFTFGMKFFGGIRADRDTMGMGFIDESIRVLEKGGVVQIFPEAHNTDDGEMHDFKPSYVLIALRSGAPIIPVMVDGNYGIKKRAHVIIGKKIYLSDYCNTYNPTREQIEELNYIVYKKCTELRTELHRRIAEDSAKKKK